MRSSWWGSGSLQLPHHARFGTPWFRSERQVSSSAHVRSKETELLGDRRRRVVERGERAGVGGAPADRDLVLARANKLDLHQAVGVAAKTRWIWRGLGLQVWVSSRTCSVIAFSLPSGRPSIPAT